ncbi:cytochrome b/b6 domain-containing protein [Pseudomonas sichuanensis]|uniref:cytochrome b n=1 Tax=Pseudomonas sichuanensis TaxID=2213015 RepID=UPI0024487D9C|nr:cytochrome b/b6 domain-containing protein [Pseudomonas sichuanensis]MDH0730838.1 cytochrome b/b6 domain-containing protein [Pseudomonas sichuanensis]MDH1582037.1 cytochrome b/b6 domain-containing protein [Pseudomonas sichuanensis]MDH1594562.1 cytochrome b/b6 domain-containing protein [Pseudomonas sichuanensis]MDH1596590.1 cytochrome b/b6 domain-containing protein [Pseudomonas sichuanensis]
MQVEKYRWQQALLHWVSAVLILWLLISGFVIAHLDVASRTFDLVAFANVALSTLYIPVFLLRWVLSLRWSKPAHLHHERSMRFVAVLVHEGLYVVTGFVLLSGVLMMNREIDVFGWFSIAPLLGDPGWQALWFTLHIAACVVLAVLLVLHIGAVMMHELLGRRVLRRMLP